MNAIRPQSAASSMYGVETTIVTPLRAEPFEHLPELAPRDGVDPGRRLVENEEPRRMDERARERELLLHAARERARRGA